MPNFNFLSALQDLIKPAPKTTPPFNPSVPMSSGIEYDNGNITTAGNNPAQSKIPVPQLQPPSVSGSEPETQVFTPRPEQVPLEENAVSDERARPWLAPQLQQVSQGFEQPEAAPQTPASSELSAPPRLEPKLLSPSQRTAQELNDLNAKDYSIKKDDAGNVISRGKDRDNDYDWKDVLGGLGLGFLKGVGKSGSIAGGIAEGAAGAFDRNYVERSRDEFNRDRLEARLQTQQKQEEFQTNQDYKKAQTEVARQRPELEREKIRNRVELEAIKQQNKIAQIKAQNANKEDDWKEFVRDGKVWKMYKNRDGSDGRAVIEALIDPDTGQQMTPAEDQLYDFYDTNSGQTVKVKGRDIVQGAIANANRETSVNQSNTSAENRYQNDVFEWQNKVTEADGQVSLKDKETAGLLIQKAELKEQADNLQNEINSLQGNDDLKDQVKAKQSELEKVRAAQNKLTADIETAKGEKQKAIDIREGLKKNRPKPPAKTQAVTTGGKYSGQVFPSPSALRSAFSGKSDEEIRRIVESNGGKFQN